MIDCYQGVLQRRKGEIGVKKESKLRYNLFVNSTTAVQDKQRKKSHMMVHPGRDRLTQIFGLRRGLTSDKFFDDQKLSGLQKRNSKIRTEGVIVRYGEGGAHVAPQCDVLIYLDMALWEIQLRMRKGLGE